jgi:RNA polymerase sigma-70 factor, ECF subfamily
MADNAVPRTSLTGPRHSVGKGGDQRPAAPAVRESFDEVVLPHLGAAYRLARWLVRDEDDAQDVVQEASLRAFRYFRTFVGGNGRAWFLRIVRNTCRGWRRHSVKAPTDLFDEEQHSKLRPASDPETLLLQIDDAKLVERAMRNVPDRFRELLVLRELDGLSYRELAAVMRVPIGTVMSSLSRARQALRGALDTELKQSGFAQTTHPHGQETDEVLVSGVNRLGQAPIAADGASVCDSRSAAVTFEKRRKSDGDESSSGPVGTGNCWSGQRARVIRWRDSNVPSVSMRSRTSLDP